MNELRRRVSGIERHHESYKLRPMGRFSHRGVDYVVSVGGPFEIGVPGNEVEHQLRKAHPNGYYEFSWAILRDDVPWIGGSNVIDRNHNPELTESARERARVNAARRDAEWAIDTATSELLEAER